MREIRSLANWKKHNLCLSIYYTIYNYNYIVATGRTDDKPTVSLCTDDNGTPATWTLVLFQQAIDRQDRTLQTEGRFSLLEPLEIPSKICITGNGSYLFKTK